MVWTALGRALFRLFVSNRFFDNFASSADAWAMSCLRRSRRKVEAPAFKPGMGLKKLGAFSPGHRKMGRGRNPSNAPPSFRFRLE
jgi:hypothetical protein